MITNTGVHDMWTLLLFRLNKLNLSICVHDTWGPLVSLTSQTLLCMTGGPPLSVLLWLMFWIMLDLNNKDNSRNDLNCLKLRKLISFKPYIRSIKFIYQN